MHEPSTGICEKGTQDLGSDLSPDVAGRFPGLALQSGPVTPDADDENAMQPSRRVLAYVSFHAICGTF
jgi:hypothetical protein